MENSINRELRNAYGKRLRTSFDYQVPPLRIQGEEKSGKVLAPFGGISTK